MSSYKCDYKHISQPAVFLHFDQTHTVIQKNPAKKHHIEPTAQEFMNHGAMSLWKYFVHRGGKKESLLLIFKWR